MGAFPKKENTSAKICGICESILFCQACQGRAAALIRGIRSFGGPKRTKRPGARENPGRGPGVSARGRGNSPCRAQTPRALSALPTPPPPDFHNASAIRLVTSFPQPHPRHSPTTKIGQKNHIHTTRIINTLQHFSKNNSKKVVKKFGG